MQDHHPFAFSTGLPSLLVLSELLPPDSWALCMSVGSLSHIIMSWRSSL